MNEPWCSVAFYRKSWCFSPMQKITRHAVADISCRDVLFSNCVMAPVYAFLQMRPEGDDLHAIVSQSVWSTSTPGKFCNYGAAVCLPLQQHTFLSSSWKCWTDKGTFFFTRDWHVWEKQQRKDTVAKGKLGKVDTFTLSPFHWITRQFCSKGVFFLSPL